MLFVGDMGQEMKGISGNISVVPTLVPEGQRHECGVQCLCVCVCLCMCTCAHVLCRPPKALAQDRGLLCSDLRTVLS